MPRYLFFIAAFTCLWANCGYLQNKVISPEMSRAAVATPRTNEPSTPEIIYCSTDNGLSWSGYNDGLPEKAEIRSIVASPEGEFRLLTQHGLYFSSPPPAAFSWLNEPVFLNNISNLYLIAGSKSLYACHYENGLYKHVKAAGIWLALHQNLSDKVVRTAIEAADGSLLAGCDSGLFKTTDGGSTWKKVFSEAKVSELFESNGVLVAIYANGIARSTDHGTTWQWQDIESGHYNFVSRINEQLCHFILKGETWSQMALDNTTGNAGAAIDLSAYRNVFQLASAGEYLFCSHAEGVSRSNDNGKTWELVFPIKNQEFYKIIIAGQSIILAKTYGC